MTKSIQYERENHRLRAKAKKVYCEWTQRTRLMKAVVTGWGGVTVFSSSEAYMFDALITHLSVHSIPDEDLGNRCLQFGEAFMSSCCSSCWTAILSCFFVQASFGTSSSVCVTNPASTPVEPNRNISLIIVIMWSVEFLTTSRTVQWSNRIYK